MVAASPQQQHSIAGANSRGTKEKKKVMPPDERDNRYMNYGLTTHDTSQVSGGYVKRGWSFAVHEPLGLGHAQLEPPSNSIRPT